MGTAPKDELHLIGQVISHYRILEQLGLGGMGVVYRAQDTRLGRQAALKFLSRHSTEDEDAKKRFIHEAQAASALDHENICTVYEIDETDRNGTFIAMAYYEGETLREKIARGALPVDEAVGIAIQISEGLARAHAKGIIHRDVKPANVIITPDGVVKIVDFGVAKLTGRTQITETGGVVGTAAYMAPEQVRGEDVDHRADVWELGAVLYEMLAARLPFHGD
ncbi:MAG: serine/threonine-protein kinase, partial [Rhodothermales bacterium]